MFTKKSRLMSVSVDVWKNIISTLTASVHPDWKSMYIRLAKEFLIRHRSLMNLTKSTGYVCLHRHSYVCGLDQPEDKSSCNAIQMTGEETAGSRHQRQVKPASQVTELINFTKYSTWEHYLWPERLEKLPFDWKVAGMSQSSWGITLILTLGSVYEWVSLF